MLKSRGVRGLGVRAKKARTLGVVGFLGSFLEVAGFKIQVPAPESQNRACFQCGHLRLDIWAPNLDP